MKYVIRKRCAQKMYHVSIEMSPKKYKHHLFLGVDGKERE